jgi:hypothetical protein
LVDGDPTAAADLEIRLAIAFEIHKPRFVLVVGFSPVTEPKLSDLPAEQVVRVVRSFQFPAKVEGVSVDVDGVARRLVEDASSQLVPVQTPGILLGPR